MYKVASKTLVRRVGHPHIVVSATLDKLLIYPLAQMHKRDSIISYSEFVLTLVAVFQSLNNKQGLSSASFSGQAIQNLQPDLKDP